MVDAETQVCLARTVVDQKRRNARDSLDAQAQDSQIEGQHFQRVDCRCRSVPTQIDVRLKSVAAQCDAPLGVRPYKMTDNRIEFFAKPTENPSLLVAKRAEDSSLRFKSGADLSD